MTFPSYEQALANAAEQCGIEPEFWDIFGHHHVTPDRVKAAIVSALGIPAETKEDIEGELRRIAAGRNSALVESCRVVSINQQPVRIPVRTGALTVAVEIKREEGTRDVFRAALDEHGEIELPAGLPLGYHELSVSADEKTSTMQLIVTPDRAFLPRFLEAGGRSAGLAVTLYGVRSERNWGCGDFRDLRGLCEWAVREMGVSFIALNPLHAIHNRQPYNASPYLPNSIFYQNFIYLDLEAIEDFGAARELFEKPEIQAEIAVLRAASHVEYERVHALKLRFLRLMFRAFKLRGPDPEFADYLREEGDLLRRFATYCALDEWLHSKDPTVWVWPDWPSGYQNPESPETVRFQKDHAEAIEFYSYMQWQIGRQLSQAQAHAKECGMPIGLYHDLALATDSCGSDLWAHRPFYVSGCRVGSPPDDFSPNGQDWAFPPPDKNHHRATGYRLFAESIRKTCRHGGALRIDHVMRFFRLFWIPAGSTATEGAYVRDYSRDLIRILALESVRNQVLVVGEDLGTVEPETRETLARFGILSYRLFYFERGPGGKYKQAREYPAQALVSSTTHDLPTLAGFWVNEDIEARRRAGMLDDHAYHAQIADRMREKQKMLDVLFESALLPGYVPRDAAEIPELTGELHNAAIGFLASTPSMLMVINQEDLSKEVSQQNLPGTTDQYRNWSRKMKFTLEELRDNPDARGFTAMLRIWLRRTGRWPATS
ncbi:MAG: 4-alpha-glucanotransferase [Acidobacteriota bacterium]|nr:4-alpha-glucanotransferase [Acidobacteriota bacterium]